MSEPRVTTGPTPPAGGAPTFPPPGSFPQPPVIPPGSGAGAGDRERIAALRQSVHATTDLVRTSTLIYLTAWALLVITAGSVTHEQLLLGAELQLPLLQVSVAPGTFFWAAPTLFLVIHGNVLLNLYLLARRVRLYEAAVNALPDHGPGSPQQHERALVPPFLFVEWRTGRQTARTMHGLLALVSWAIYVILPVSGLLFVQYKFLPYQNEKITGWHVALLALDLVLLWTIWPRLGPQPGGWWPAIRALAGHRRSAAPLALAAIATPATVLVALALW